MEARLSERPYPGDDLEISVSVKKHGVVIERDLRDAAIDRAPNRAAHAAQVEEGPSRILP